MNHLHLLIPDLFLPQDAAAHACAGLRLPALEKLLARGEQTALPATTLEDFFCERFGVDAVAPVRAAADGLDVASGFWLCADPVHLQVQPSQVVLLPEVGCTAEEAAALCDTLNKYFAGDGLSFFAPQPQRWYVRCADSSDVALTPLRAAAWRDVRLMQAQGAEATRWRCVGNEIQMLLHGHAVNLAREAQGLPIINSVWLWGNGSAGVLRSGFDAVGGDDELSLAFGRAAGASVFVGASLLANFASKLAPTKNKNALWVCAAPAAAWQRGDLYVWREAVQALEREVAQPLLHALRSGRLKSLTLDVLMESSTQRFELGRGGVWQVWRSRRPLAHFAV
ncbi:MAG: hypothetical protein PHQ60_10040 [Sideroxydans sp.]|nr:hypothetical protein [Sideroxydans sp.]